MTASQSPAFAAAITAFHAPHSAETSDVMCPTLGDDRARIAMGTCDFVVTPSDRHGRMRRRAHDI